MSARRACRLPRIEEKLLQQPTKGRRKKEESLSTFHLMEEERREMKADLVAVARVMVLPCL